jgi:LPXTG-site transpeptidase (sortase) family protein
MNKNNASATIRWAEGRRNWKLMYTKASKSLKLIFRAAIIIIIISSMFSLLPSVGATEGTRITIPAIEVDATVVSVYVANLPEGTTWDMRRLNHNVGHLDGTAWFGEAGNTVLGGHSELSERRPSVFLRLGELQPGSEIIINVNGTDYRYAVSGVQNYAVSDLTPLYPSSGELLTLLTCDPASYNAETGGYDRRIAVTANRVG